MHVLMRVKALFAFASGCMEPSPSGFLPQNVMLRFEYKEKTRRQAASSVVVFPIFQKDWPFTETDDKNKSPKPNSHLSSA